VNHAEEEARRRIIERVDALPAEQREVFLLRTQQELSFAEIAKLLGVPLNTALGRMHYAVTKLRRELEMEHEQH
jgi:RNA polymerase sigma-70 factor (ECF subfamily)